MNYWFFHVKFEKRFVISFTKRFLSNKKKHFSWGTVHAFFPEGGVWQIQGLFGFLSWRKPGTHGVFVDRVQKTRWSAEKQ
jgi:hypothetical protein